MNKVIEWFLPYQNVEKIKFNEAQELSKKAREEINEETKKMLYDKLIMGTMYVVYNYILSSKIYLLLKEDFDIDDLISSFTRQWITLLKTNDLSNYTNFSHMMNSTNFAGKAVRGMSNDKATEERADQKDFDDINNEAIKKYVKIYADCINKKGVCFINDIFPAMGKWSSTADAALVIETFDYLCDNGWKKRILENEALSKYDLELIQHFLIQTKNKVREGAAEEVIDENANLDNNLDNMFYNDAIKSGLSTLNERERFVITKKFGLDGKGPMSLKEISNILGITPNFVRNIEIKAIKKIRWEFFKRRNSRLASSNLLDKVNKGYPLSQSDFYLLAYWLNNVEIKVARMMYGTDSKTPQSIAIELNLSPDEINMILIKIKEVLKNIKTDISKVDGLEDYKLNSFKR